MIQIVQHLFENVNFFENEKKNIKKSYKHDRMTVIHLQEQNKQTAEEIYHINLMFEFGYLNGRNVTCNES